MFLAALLDAGVPAQVFHDAVAALDLGASVKFERVDRSGIACTKAHVLDHGRRLHEADEHAVAPGHEHPHEHSHADAHTHKHPHAHKHEHPHEPGSQNEHPHVHGRSLTAIRSLIQAAALDEKVKSLAINAFETLGHSEARIHNVDVEQIHFHEVGATDAIVDIVAVCAGLHHLQVDAWYCSPVNVGSGMVQCAHGTFPVPAPATADLLRSIPTYAAHVEKELVTPTGATLLRALQATFGAQPAMRVSGIGYGAGTRNPKGFPNVLRLFVGEATEDGSEITREPAKGKAAGTLESLHGNGESHSKRPTDPHASPHVANHGHAHTSATVAVLETALDDLSPQVLAYVAEQALAQGALDVMLTPVVMKKGRPGTLLTILCNPADRHALEHLLLRETSTLGVRMREDRRSCLERKHVSVETPYGPVRIKVGSLGERELNVAPEFEDCRAAALQHRVALKQVQQAALAAYLRPE
ncbi:nickel pincer cofactor biosynthesis protein LarC [Acidipila sp. EB88]|uniref:nickel pincer cofactor biosynthesis protein LarC n=1 Tax=Acidipila sp. EB88 TaxID=2305226 RepID=UPI001F290724|nr:nickel pincer cofactor biosynthesis protein LarC [Acidipila sp. EB88]